MRGKKEKRIGERRDICGIGGRYHKKMKITIRNGDWTFCKYTKFNLDNMSGNRHWEHVLGRSKELRMGLEIRGKQKEVLVPIINKLKKFEFNIGGGESLVAEEKATENGWMGPIEEYPQKETWEGPEYYVATVV